MKLDPRRSRSLVDARTSRVSMSQPPRTASARNTCLLWREFGPDLAEVAAIRKLSAEEVIRVHYSATYTRIARIRSRLRVSRWIACAAGDASFANAAQAGSGR